MLTVRRVLLASHGTPGARAAERLAFSVLEHGGVLLHLVVVPDLWRGMMGDDWLNNASTRDAYGKHIETQLAREIDAYRAEVQQKSREQGVTYEAETVIGKPASCLVDYALRATPELIVIGSPRPPGTSGLRSRLLLESLVKSLAAPLLVAPHPK